MKRLCVYCGSRDGQQPAYLEAARALGRLLAERGIGLVYGGASIGVMGTLANAVLDGGGEAIGVIPRALDDREVGHRGLTELHVVETMHERKNIMSVLSDGFVALPGGLGTFEELFEVWTWAQLGVHRKPVGLLNAGGFYDPLLAFLDHATAEGFVEREHRDLVTVAGDPASLLDAMHAYKPSDDRIWLKARQV
ncbi:Rossman fold protein, TIGR00730 family [Rhodothalassium salexigens]|uniref:LOG family protein n=1 Tax=Rhodothalassium salexigens TaxID=1086 RepID=UPI001912936A|nr:TIGR00730 family Rossman fold protein [Rhodothalassium salexigens]MBK5911753.1 Rossman fold protein, TIGR00730 family [Rhodothalassium salexigens]MBK5920459.1 Rossman fold protein, TIGR00730 family [Rhodothalassium salexigens]